MPRPLRLLTALTVLLAALALTASSALASTRQVTIMEDNQALQANPMGTLEKMKSMGVTDVKYTVTWGYMLPDPGARTAPRGSDSPSYYDQYFGFLVKLDQAVQKVGGLKLDFLVTGPAPRWAEGSTQGCVASAISQGTCRPDPADFRIFVEALGAYFNGSVSGVPAVRSWAIWNEPNYVPNLAPQAGGGIDTAADLYRGLVDAAWAGLATTGHTTATDTILFGDLAPRAISGRQSGAGAGIKPVQFIASLYCSTVAGRRLTGTAARANQCPASASTFRAQNPALFDASGVADHPYSQGTAPTNETADCDRDGQPFCLARGKLKPDPLWTDLASIANLENVVDRATRAEGAERRLMIWNTEFGYWTSPPGKNACHSAAEDYCDLSQAQAAVYLNEAEYISYENPRIASFDQYQLYDPAVGAWTDGLLTRAGRAKATFDAWELPLWMPTATLQHAGSTRVWGGVKPAAYAAVTDAAKPEVDIQFKSPSGGWKTLKTVTVSTTSPGSYFTTSVRLSTSGAVRLRYTLGATVIDSRVQAVTVRQAGP